MTVYNTDADLSGFLSLQFRHTERSVSRRASFCGLTRVSFADIVVTFKKAPKTAKLEVLFNSNDIPVSLTTPVKTDDKTYRWPLSTEMYVSSESTGCIINVVNCGFSRIFAKFGDTLILKVTKEKRRSCFSGARKDGPKTLTLTYDGIANKFKEPGHSEYMNTLMGYPSNVITSIVVFADEEAHWSVRFEVAAASIVDVRCFACYMLVTY